MQRRGFQRNTGQRSRYSTGRNDIYLGSACSDRWPHRRSSRQRSISNRNAKQPYQHSTDSNLYGNAIDSIMHRRELHSNSYGEPKTDYSSQDSDSMQRRGLQRNTGQRSRYSTGRNDIYLGSACSNRRPHRRSSRQRSIDNRNAKQPYQHSTDSNLYGNAINSIMYRSEIQSDGHSEPSAFNSSQDSSSMQRCGLQRNTGQRSRHCSGRNDIYLGSASSNRRPDRRNSR